MLNTLGMAQMALGDEEGVALLRRAIEMARDTDDLDDLAHAYANLADMLGLRAQREGLGVAREGLERPPRGSRAAMTG